MRASARIRQAFTCSIFALMTVAAPECFGVVVSFSNPVAGQNYGIGANITYNGGATWTGSDPTIASIQIELRYGSATTGAIVDSESADFLNHGGGSTAFLNPTPPTLQAAQYASSPSPYFLVGTPYSAANPYIVGGVVYRTSVTLGTIK